MSCECNPAIEQYSCQPCLWEALKATMKERDTPRLQTEADRWHLSEASKVIDALRAALEGLFDSPIVSGLGAAIRDRARKDGKDDPYEKAMRVLSDIPKR